jgi:hypothetical protein
MVRRTSHFETQGPSLFARCFAALFSGAVAGATCAVRAGLAYGANQHLPW